MGPHVKQINIRRFQVLGTIQKTLLGGGAFLGGCPDFAIHQGGGQAIQTLPIFEREVPRFCQILI